MICASRKPPKNWEYRMYERKPNALWRAHFQQHSSCMVAWSCNNNGYISNHAPLPKDFSKRAEKPHYLNKIKVDGSLIKLFQRDEFLPIVTGGGCRHDTEQDF